MPTPNGEQFTSLHLFDPSQYDEEKTPGQMSMDEWLETQDPIFHSTFRPEFSQAPTAHYGTMGAAVEALKSTGTRISRSQMSAQKYYHPSYDELLDDDDPSIPSANIGRVYARRMKEAPSSSPIYSDAVANSADAYYRTTEGGEAITEVPSSVRYSGLFLDYGINDRSFKLSLPHETSQDAYQKLLSNKPIIYDNVVEVGHRVDEEYPHGPSSYTKKFFMEKHPKTSSFSVVAPKEAVSSWERDVLEDPKSSIFAKQFAQQRIGQGKEGAVRFPHPEAPFEETPSHFQTRLEVKGDGTLGKGPDAIVPDLPDDQDERLRLTDEYQVPRALG